MLADQPPFLSVQQASKLLHVSTWTVYQAIRSGELPVIRWGRRVVVQREDLASLVASKRQEAIESLTRGSLLATSTRRNAYPAAAAQSITGVAGNGFESR